MSYGEKNLRFFIKILFFLNIQRMSDLWPMFNKQVTCLQLSETQRKKSCQVSNIRKKPRKVGGRKREDKLMKHLLREHTNTQFIFNNKNPDSFSWKYCIFREKTRQCTFNIPEVLLHGGI